MENFDMLLVKGRGIIATIIEKVTKAPYSHAAIVIDKYHVVETSWNYPLRIRHISYKLGDYDIYRYPGLLPSQKDSIRLYLLSVLNLRYDYLQVITHFFYLIFRWPIIHTNSRFICTEVIDKGFKAAGIELLPGFTLDSISPADLAQSKLLKKVTELGVKN